MRESVKIDFSPPVRRKEKKPCASGGTAHWHFRSKMACLPCRFTDSASTGNLVILPRTSRGNGRTAGDDLTVRADGGGHRAHHNVQPINTL